MSDIANYLKQHEIKPVLSFIASGNVDDGKSTLIERLFYLPLFKRGIEGDLLFASSYPEIKSKSPLAPLLQRGGSSRAPLLTSHSAVEKRSMGESHV